MNPLPSPPTIKAPVSSLYQKHSRNFEESLSKGVKGTGRRGQPMVSPGQQFVHAMVIGSVYILNLSIVMRIPKTEVYNLAKNVQSILKSSGAYNFINNIFN